MAYCIYRLDDPRDNSTRYVGLSKDAYRRYAMHLLNMGRTKTPKDKWIEELRQEGLAPVLVIIEADIVSLEKARVREFHWIQTYRKESAPLTNQTNTYETTSLPPSTITSKPIRTFELPDGRVALNWELDARARGVAMSMNGRVIGRWHTDGERIAYVFSLAPGKRHKMISMGMPLSQFIELAEDELRERIRRAIAESEGES